MILAPSGAPSSEMFCCGQRRFATANQKVDDQARKHNPSCNFFVQFVTPFAAHFLLLKTGMEHCQPACMLRGELLVSQAWRCSRRGKADNLSFTSKDFVLFGRCLSPRTWFTTFLELGYLMFTGSVCSQIPPCKIPSNGMPGSHAHSGSGLQLRSRLLGWEECLGYKVRSWHDGSLSAWFVGDCWSWIDTRALQSSEPNLCW